MSTIMRTLRNLRRIGLKEYGHQMQHMGDTKAGVLVGTDRYGNRYFENRTEELPLRTRWVDYADYDNDASQIEPGWHAWMSYMIHDPPAGAVNALPRAGGTEHAMGEDKQIGGEGDRAPGEALERGGKGKVSKGAGTMSMEAALGSGEELKGDELLRLGVRAWELPGHRPNMTQTRAAYRPYSTVKPKIHAWQPRTIER